MSKHAVRARAGQDRASLYDEITDKIIAELEAGRPPWVQPWGTATAKAPLSIPKNVLGEHDRTRFYRTKLAYVSPGDVAWRTRPQR
jgi:hypothetical protein